MYAELNLAIFQEKRIDQVALEEPQLILFILKTGRLLMALGSLSCRVRVRCPQL